MEVDSIKESPQVHIHFLTGSEEMMELGYGKIELCCHGCGNSLLVLYVEPEADDEVNPDTRHLKFRDEFHQKHKLCPDRGYDRMCPNQRSKFDVVDLRTTTKRISDGPRPRGGREGLVSSIGPGMVRYGRRAVRKETPKGHR